MTGNPAGSDAEAVDRGGFFTRLLLGSRRKLDIAIDDLGQDALRIVRPFVWWHNRALVTEDGRAVGSVRQRWTLIGRRYTVHDERGELRYELREQRWFAVGTTEIELVVRRRPEFALLLQVVDGSTGEPVERRDAATAAACAVGVFAGADAVRVHDVAATVHAVTLGHALRGARRPEDAS